MNTTKLVRVQVVIAILALAVMAFSFYQLGPLNEKLSVLKTDIAELEIKRDELKRTNTAITSVARPIDESRKDIDGWLYVGRTNKQGKWAPPSEGVVPSPSRAASENFDTVVVTKDSTFADKLDGTNDIKSTQPSSGPVQFVKAGTTLKVLEIQSIPSIGDGTYVWVKVSIPSIAILEIQG